MKSIDEYSSKDYILIKGAKQHNLKNVNVAIARNKLVVITGLSGSGKSSLAFDTLYAEGQRRYIESLSAYARQFLGKINKPKVEYIKGISPTVAIEQKVNTANPRSTVGTSTEIYDYFKLLFARIGKIYSPISGNEVKKDTVTDVIDFIKKKSQKDKILLLIPIHFQEEKELKQLLNNYLQQGYSRVKIDDELIRIDKILDTEISIKENVFLVIDRWQVSDDEDFYNRVADSTQTAFYEGNGSCILENITQNQTNHFSNKLELDGITFTEPTVHLFNFNSPVGACNSCQGYAYILGIDEKLVIPNTNLSVYEDAIMAWRGNMSSKWKHLFIQDTCKIEFPIHKPYHELSEKQKYILWNSKYGIHNFFKEIEKQSYKVQNAVLLSRYRGKTKCNLCNGTRLCKEANYIKINQRTLSELVNLPLVELLDFVKKLKLNNYQQKVAERLLFEIKTRLQFSIDIGLGYLTLNRNSNSLSGGESQRINLITSLSSSLVGAIYVLDEPSIGLHSSDTQQLIKVLKSLRDLGNTVVVVEHDEDVMRAADVIIDMGPEAGVKGGELVFNGNFKEIKKSKTLTSKYLNGELKVYEKRILKPFKNYIEIKGVRENNLKNITVKFPLNTFTVVTGVSGSGKSSLVNKVLYPALQKHIDDINCEQGEYDEISGSLGQIQKVEFISQNPIGKSSRSNPVTYIKAYDKIRHLMASTPLAKKKKLDPKHFSFNVDAGRCEECKGEGEIVIQMQFMADIRLTCELCKGKRFQQGILDIKFENKNISDILHMSIDEAVEFFTKHKCEKIAQKIEPLQRVGMGYVALGQPSNTLSGGEAQRVKLASFLDYKNQGEKVFFIFDEPTTGLHFHDVKKLLRSLNNLVENGHTVLVIEHNLDIVKCADWIIDLGIGSGTKGGELIFEGTPKELTKNNKSITGKFL